MLVSMPVELVGKISFEDGVPILEGASTQEEEDIFQKFVKRLEECEQEKFKID